MVVSAGAVAAIPADNSQANENNQAPDTPDMDKEAPGQSDSHPLDDPEHPGNVNQNATENVPDHVDVVLPFTVEIEPSVVNEDQDEEYEGIQEALDEAEEGDELTVYGEHKEDVSIETDEITLTAATTHVSSIEGTIDVKANDVTIEGLTITADAPVVVEPQGEDITIDNNIIETTKDFDDNAYLAIGEWFGTELFSGDITITDNELTGAIGFYVSEDKNSDSEIEITDNTVNDAGDEAIWICSLEDDEPSEVVEDLTVEGNDVGELEIDIEKY
ncbi:right-handed parallel beta-helix repeat-containing protein [Methanonatronarchaeum sp. AMET-Sl]|uniref:right-handed parallel beta-helix repeat-containing protein n=1 Tax=Methanonatronarchaeum sp. AMET-Sl TaxID=3037654 RepID=UPI00244E336E|nr:right-handed parallel beta-helix repeat-containing protein [Methanonatronarchaeum sp. AMET-Sl]WGI17125.1 right-handed parallel beta-helix repeat-containing protein [Methanonatronarchaeum sp. AMET-Sl]